MNNMIAIKITQIRIRVNGEKTPFVDGVLLFNRIKALGGINIELHDKNNYYHEGAQIRVIVDKLDLKRTFGHLYRVEKEFPENDELISFLEEAGNYKVDHRGAFLVNLKHAEGIMNEWLPDQAACLAPIETTGVFEGVKVSIVPPRQKKKNRGRETLNLLQNVFNKQDGVASGRVSCTEEHVSSPPAENNEINHELIEACKTGFSNNHEIKVGDLISPIVITAQTFAPPPDKTKSGRNKKNTGMAAFREVQLKLGTPKKLLDSFEDLTPKYRKFLRTYGKDDNGKTGN